MRQVTFQKNPTQSITIDTTAPNAPTDLATSRLVTNDTTPTITGKAEANSFVTLLNVNKVLGTATVTNKGNFSITSSL